MSANEPTLDDLRRTGYVVDEWSRWQQGGCLAYAVALIELRPNLRLGTLAMTDGEYCIPAHHFAYDDTYAYDSAGRHALPYRGVTFTADVVMLDEDVNEYDEVDPVEVLAAKNHCQRHNICSEVGSVATCPCGATDHVLATHPDVVRYGFTPTYGEYVMDDPIAEHRDGEHDAHPDADSCAACAALGDG